MEIVTINEQEEWEEIRAGDPRLHFFSFSWNWLQFQAERLPGKQVTLGLRKGSKIIDIFAGIRQNDQLFAGAQGSPGGCADPHHLPLFLEALGQPRCYLTSAEKVSLLGDTIHYMMIDLKLIDTVETYLRTRVADEIRRQCLYAKRFTIVPVMNQLNDFYECYQEFAARNHLQYPLSKEYFQKLKSYLREELIIKSFYLDGFLVGASLIIITPGHLHSNFLIARAEAEQMGISAYLCVDVVQDALAMGKRWVNCGPAAPWDGIYEFRKRCGAEPFPCYTSIINGNFWESTAFRVKKDFKRLIKWKSALPPKALK